MTDIKEGIYNVRIALNLDHLVTDKIESISLIQCHGDRSGALEVGDRLAAVYRAGSAREYFFRWPQLTIDCSLVTTRSSQSES